MRWNLTLTDPLLDETFYCQSPLTPTKTNDLRQAATERQDDRNTKVEFAVDNTPSPRRQTATTLFLLSREIK